MFKLILTAFLALGAIASELSLQSGVIEAKTKIFGDSNINPSTEQINSSLQMDSSLESIQGVIVIKSVDLKSDKKDRDSNMYELLNATLYPTISFELNSITKQEENYLIEGVLTLNNIQKPIVSIASISQLDNSINLLGDFSILLSEYGMTPPSMLFLTVRDQIDIRYNLHYKKN